MPLPLPLPRLQVTAVFGSSLEVMISVFGESPAEGVVFHCADAFATLVMVGPEGRPRTCPFQLRPSSELEVLRWGWGWGRKWCGVVGRRAFDGTLSGARWWSSALVVSPLR